MVHCVIGHVQTLLVTPKAQPPRNLLANFFGQISLRVLTDRGGGVRKLTQGLHATCLCPNECFVTLCSSGGRVGDADDRSLIIDRRGRIPGIASDVPKVSRNTVLPKHGVSSADTSNRHTAIAGD